MKRNYVSVLVASAAMAMTAAGARAGDVKSDQPVKDSFLTTKVKAELAKDKGTNARDIHVTTKDGVVMLDGTVASQAEKELAEHDAKRIKGVVAVHNGLTVQ
jgi:hyperosmotically inducible periplasmic protein